MSYNALTVEMYNGATRAGGTEVYLEKMTGLAFSKAYPGGMFTEASFFVPRNVEKSWTVKEGMRMVVRNHMRIVWEGKVTNLQDTIADDGQGTLVRAAGFWGEILDRWSIQKWWCLSSVDEPYWIYQTDEATYTGADACTLDREERLRLTPRPVAWDSDEFAAVRCTAPSGDTWKAIICVMELDEGGQDWEAQLYNVTAAAAEASLTTTTDNMVLGSPVGYTFGTPTTAVELRLISKAAQTPTENRFAELRSIKLFSDTGDASADITLETICKNIVSIVTDLNSDTSRIISMAARSLPLEPYVVDYMSAAAVINDVIVRGDSSQVRLAAYVDHSETATTPDGKPVLVVEEYATDTDYDYAVSLADANLAKPFTISKDIDSVQNWMVVSYIDDKGVKKYVSGSDTGGLYDSTSIASYGRRAPKEPYDIGESSSVIAEAYGKRLLAQLKNPQYHMPGPLSVRGFIRGKNAEERIPTSEIAPGKRVRIEDIDKTFVITQTSYSDTEELAQMNVGAPMMPMTPKRMPRSPGILGPGPTSKPAQPRPRTKRRRLGS